MDFELTDKEIKKLTKGSSFLWDEERHIARAAQRKLVEKQERMFNRLISAQSRKDLLESPEWQELRKGVGL